MRTWASALVVAGLLVGMLESEDVDTLKLPTFGQVVVCRPASPPMQVVLFISGDGGWNLGVVSMAERLRTRSVSSASSM
jgi:type IV secretory pathway VirJ component